MSKQPRARNFYPRPPRGGRRACIRRAADSSNFYPRPPRGGRRRQCGPKGGGSLISIHALREEGDAILRSAVLAAKGISIHALREEGDLPAAAIRSVIDDFYPRPPRGGRHNSTCPFLRPHNFYPRPPRGGRQQWMRDPYTLLVFLSTPSARRAT